MPVRKIYFYRIKPRGKGSKFPWKKSDIAALKSLWNNHPDGAYVGVGEGDVMMSVVSKNTPDMARILFGRSRRSALPPTETGGQLRPLALQPKEGLCETTFLQVYPKENLLVADYNFHGPRVLQFPWYLKQALSLRRLPFDLKQILRNDALAQMKSLQHLTWLKMEIGASYAEELAAEKGVVGDVGQYLHQLNDTTGGTSIAVTLKSSRKRGAPPLNGVVRRFVAAVGRRDRTRQEATKFIAAGPSLATGRITPVDLLGDMFVDEADIPHAGNTKALDASKAFKALGAAYKKHKHDLDTLPTIDVRRAAPRRA